METSLLIAVVGAVATVLGATAGVIISGLFQRKRTQAETTSIAVTIYEKVIAQQNAEIERRIKTYEDQTSQITRLESEIRVIKFSHHECEQKCRAHSIEMKILKGYIKDNEINLSPVKIFLLEDSDWEIDFFKKRFENISVVELISFEEIRQLENNLDQKPEILILDYYIHGNNIDFLIKKIISTPNYEPKMIIVSGMSNDKFLKLTYKDHVWHFFNKEDDHLNKVVNAILEYVEEKMKL